MRTHLSIPPPAKQRSVRNPSLEFVLIEEIEIGANHMGEGLGAFGVAHGLLEEARVIVAKDIVTARFMEVFVFGRGIEAVVQPKGIGECRIGFGLGVGIGVDIGRALNWTGQSCGGGPQGEAGCEHPPHLERSRYA